MSVMTVCLIALSAFVAGCISPIAMHQAVLAYDRSVERITSEELLLNVLRARAYQPVHFTRVASVAATFDFRVSAGITPPEGDARGLVGPVFSATMAENPTVTIVPIDGEEFTTRLLTPIDESRFFKLLEVGADLGMALRMVASSLRIDAGDAAEVYLNDPSRPEEYEEFRRRVLHLDALQDRHVLHIDSVMSEQVWTGRLSSGLEAPDVLAALDKGYRWTAGNEEGAYRLNRMRILIANYPSQAVSDDVRQALADRLKEWPPNNILVDVRPGYPGGEYPMTGQITLRSFNSVLEFLARTAQEAPEYRVPQDRRTSHVRINAPEVLKIEESDRPFEQAAVSIRYGDRYFAIARPAPDDAEGIWNLKAFDMLYQLFQMMVQPSAAPVPGIAIAK